MTTYRLSQPYSRPPLQRRLTGLALALAVNLALLLILMTLGIIAPPSQKSLRGIVVNMIPANRSTSPTKSAKVQQQRRHVEASSKPALKKPPIILPSKPTITPPPQATTKRAPKSPPWIEMSEQEMASGDISKIAAAGSGSAGDSEVVGHGPNGEDLYAAEWARRPTDAELAGYLPRSAPEGFGLIACKTAAGNRVEDCIELDQEPRGSHLASSVRQAAWQFHVRPPRKGGKAMIGAWVRIRIDYSHYGGGD